MAVELKLSLPNKNLSVGQTSATIKINYSGLSELKNSSGTTSKTEYSDIELQYSFNNKDWYKIPDDREVTRSSLTEGSKNNITVYCRRSYTVTTYTREPEPWPSTGYTDWEEDDSEDKTDSKINETISVYTKDSTTSWSWGASSGAYIDQTLTTTNLTNWIAYLRTYQSWYWQDNKSSDYSALSQGAKTDISATWYNNCYNARYNTDTTKVNGLGTHGVAATYISAKLINDLNFSADDWTKKNSSL